MLASGHETHRSSSGRPEQLEAHYDHPSSSGRQCGSGGTRSGPKNAQVPARFRQELLAHCARSTVIIPNPESEADYRYTQRHTAVDSVLCTLYRRKLVLAVTAGAPSHRHRGRLSFSTHQNDRARAPSSKPARSHVAPTTSKRCRRRPGCYSSPQAQVEAARL